ncbi:MAG: histidinol-phosphatase [Lachnospiraceae bacterium]|nr:histidinol-phosphatase [Lachnospiraceae bacterium]
MAQYKIETHLHTAEGSKCGWATGVEQAEARFMEGYSTIIVTDHFFRGNTRPDRSLPWEEYVDQFCSGYEHAKKRGDEIGLTVLFGLEDNYQGSEFLIYGLDKDWLKKHPDMRQWTPWEEYEHVHGDGGYMVQAHPFREASYLFGFGLYPMFTDAVEGINAAQTKAMNERAIWYAGQFDKPMTAGSDIHGINNVGGGILAPHPINTIEDYINMIRNREDYELIEIHRPENPSGAPSKEEFFKMIEKQKAEMKAFADAAAKKLREAK